MPDKFLSSNRGGGSATLQREIEKLEARFASLSSSVSAIDTNNSSLNTSVSGLSTSVSGLSTSVTALDTNVTALGTSVTTIDNKTNTKQDSAHLNTLNLNDAYLKRLLHDTKFICTITATMTSQPGIKFYLANTPEDGAVFYALADETDATQDIFQWEVDLNTVTTAAGTENGVILINQSNNTIPFGSIDSLNGSAWSATNPSGLNNSVGVNQFIIEPQQFTGNSSMKAFLKHAGNSNYMSIEYFNDPTSTVFDRFTVNAYANLFGHTRFGGLNRENGELFTITANATPPPIAYTMPAAAANGLAPLAFDPLGYWTSFATEVDVNLMPFHNEYGSFSISQPLSTSVTSYVALQANGSSSYPYIYSYTNAATLPSNNATIITLVYNHARSNFMVDSGYSGNEQVYKMLFQSPINGVDTLGDPTVALKNNDDNGATSITPNTEMFLEHINQGFSNRRFYIYFLDASNTKWYLTYNPNVIGGISVSVNKYYPIAKMWEFSEALATRRVAPTPLTIFGPKLSSVNVFMMPAHQDSQIINTTVSPFYVGLADTNDGSAYPFIYAANSTEPEPGFYTIDMPSGGHGNSSAPDEVIIQITSNGSMTDPKYTFTFTETVNSISVLGTTGINMANALNGNFDISPSSEIYIESTTNDHQYFVYIKKTDGTKLYFTFVTTVWKRALSLTPNKSNPDKLWYLPTV